MSRRLQPPPIIPPEPPPIDTYKELERIREAALHGRVSPLDAIRLVRKIEELKRQLFGRIETARMIQELDHDPNELIETADYSDTPQNPHDYD